MLFEIIYFLRRRYPKIVHVLNNVQLTSFYVFILHCLFWLHIMKMKWKIVCIDARCIDLVLHMDTNILNKKSVSCIKQLQSIIWSSVHEKVKQRWDYRSSGPDVFCKKGVLRNLSTFTGKHLCQSLFFDKVAGLSPAALLKKDWHRCFPVNFVKFLRTLFL